MNYQNLYNNLINSAIENPKEDSYKETHHIIPRCLGGSDEKDNLVRLTARQHFIAHWLLYKIHKNYKLASAWCNMAMIDKNQTRRLINSKNFERARKARAKHLSAVMSGEDNPFYGKTRSEESLNKIKNSLRLYYQSERWTEVKKTLAETCSKTFKGIPKSKESNLKRARKNMLMLKNVLSGECVRIHRDEKENYDTSIWKNPYAIAHSGVKNNSRWCTDGINNIKLKCSENLPEGYRYGRTVKQKNHRNQEN